MSFLRAVLTCAAALAVLGGTADAKSPPRYGMLVYSDLCYDPPSDDIGGTRITLLRFHDGDKILYENTEGAVNWPVFASNAKVDAKSGALTFELRTNEETLAFNGKFDDGVLTGTLSGRNDPITLDRVRNIGRDMPKCKFDKP